MRKLCQRIQTDFVHLQILSKLSHSDAFQVSALSLFLGTGLRAPYAPPRCKPYFTVGRQANSLFLLYLVYLRIILNCTAKFFFLHFSKNKGNARLHVLYALLDIIREEGIQECFICISFLTRHRI